MEFTLHNLRPKKGSKSVAKRIGRGPGSGSGKTSGKGHKGQKARSGGSIAAHFEGGQMPLYRRIPKLGFRSRKKIRGKNSFTLLKTSVLNRFEDGTMVDAALLAGQGIKVPQAGKGSAGLKLLVDEELKTSVTVKVDAASKSAIEAVVAKGGQVELVAAE